MPKKLTQEEFVKRAKQIHGDRYDYSKVEYVDMHTKVCIICPEHGEFWQKPLTHLYSGGHGCIDCVNKRPHNKETFIKKSRQIHGDKYDYSKVEYVNNKTKVCIICPEHGEFWQKPEKHMNQGHGCPKCGGTGKLTQKEFIDKCKIIHHFKYDYSKVDYINTETKVCIICPEHGEFWQTPHSHLQGADCPFCKGCIKLTQEEFVKRAKQIHGNKYDYSKSIYNSYETKVCIICPEHGEFWQTPHSHLQGQGCPYCNGLYKTTGQIITEFREIHKDKYDYSKVDYINTETKVCIICPEHGEFWQTPHSHLQGQGCPYCNESKLEKEINLFLTENDLVFKRQKTFEWLKDKSNLYLDFYLPDYNIAIECQGIQHFKPIEYFGGIEMFQRQQYLDYLKYHLCADHNIKIFYYSKVKLPYFQNIEDNIENLLKQIKNYEKY